MASILPVIIANQAREEQERYDNDPQYRMAVLQDQEARTRKKIRHDIDRIQHPGRFACCRDHEKALAKHQKVLRGIQAEEATTEPLLPR